MISNIYLLIGETQKGPYSEKDIQAMYVAGSITEETLHWKEGMADWQNIGPRDQKTGQSRSEPSTIAPPRRSLQSGEALSYEPADLKKKHLKTEFSSARTKPLTPLRAVFLILLFFIILTIVIEGVSRTVPDAGKKFAESVSRALAWKKE